MHIYVACSWRVPLWPPCDTWHTCIPLVSWRGTSPTPGRVTSVLLCVCWSNLKHSGAMSGAALFRDATVHEGKTIAD